MSGNKGIHHCLAGLAVAALAVMASPASAAESGIAIKRQPWSFSGVFGHYDRGQVQRGLKVVKEVCSACHSMNLVRYRNLADPGGPELSEGQVKTLAAEAEFFDIDDAGEPAPRKGVPADPWKAPFANAQAARAANGGALPPDLSLIAKAREATDPKPWYLEPFKWARDIVTGYQEGGPDYIYALLTGYGEVPPDLHNADGTPFTLAEGMNFNRAFPGFQIAMPNPLTDGQVEYTDGTPATVDNYARDVAAFLMWAAEPKLEERKQLGVRVMIFLIITSILLWLAKRALWARAH
jgi:cytochrome c1